MNIYLKSTKVIGSCILLTNFLFPLLSHAQSGIQANFNGSSMSLVVPGDFVEAILTVDGNGTQFSQTFTEGQSLEIDLSHLTDGIYNWDLSVLTYEGQAFQEEMDSNAEEGEEPEGMASFGKLLILDGIVENYDDEVSEAIEQAEKEKDTENQ